MRFHEAANIFPLDEEHLDELAADIRQNGQKIPIETLNGAILDGRRRWLACEKAGVQPALKAVNPADPVAYVLSLNLHRRHLTPSQASMVGARARDWYDRQAKERQREAGKVHGRGKEQVQENLPEPIAAGQARDQVAKVVGVSGKSIDYATKVIKEAVPEVVRAVDEGRMAVSTAAILASEPEEVQREEATKPKRKRRYDNSGRTPATKHEPVEAKPNGSRPAIGRKWAYEAINCLKRIPENDTQREEAFKMVRSFMLANP